MNIIFIIIFICLLSMAIAGISFAPWVPCWKKDMVRIFALADLQPGEIFYELGSGTGKNVIYANKYFGVKAIGLEIAIPFYLISKVKQLFLGKRDIRFKYKNLFSEDLSQADVVYFFGMPKQLKDKLKNKLAKELKPGARVVSYAFAIEGWQPVTVSRPKKTDVAIYLYKM